MEVTLLGIVIEVNPLQLQNAYSPMEVTPVGMVIEVKPLQPLNAHSPMEVTPFGIVIEVKPLQPLTKFAGILCTLSPILTVVSGVRRKGCLLPASKS